jgi:hypothetical protein
VQESDSKPTAKGAFGLEYQIIHDGTHPDSKQENRRTAGIYDVAAPGPKNLNDAGKWNHLKIVVNKGDIEQWLNGDRVLAFKQGGQRFKEWKAGSKYKNSSIYGARTNGHIVLQEHGAAIWFRNIKVREIN